MGYSGSSYLAAVDGLYELVVNRIDKANPMKMYHLDLRPRVEGMLSDLICDSDGKMNRFISGRLSLPLHEFGGGGRKEGGYYLGMFLGRAYQEALGGLHNLFGGLSVVRVDGPHCFAVTWVVLGPSCVDVLQAMQHKPELMFEALKRWAEEESTAREGGVVDASAVATALARAFRSIPYLVVVGEAGGDEMSSNSESSAGVDYE